MKLSLWGNGKTSPEECRFHVGLMLLGGVGFFLASLHHFGVPSHDLWFPQLFCDLSLPALLQCFRENDWKGWQACRWEGLISPACHQATFCACGSLSIINILPPWGELIPTALSVPAMQLQPGLAAGLGQLLARCHPAASLSKYSFNRHIYVHTFPCRRV